MGWSRGESWLHKSFFSPSFSACSQCVTELLLLFVKVGKCIQNVADMEPISHTVLFFPYVIWTCLISQRLFIIQACIAAAYMIHSVAWVCCSLCGCIPLCQGNISGNQEGNFSQSIRAELITWGSMVPQSHSRSVRRSPVHGVPQPVQRLY